MRQPSRGIILAGGDSVRFGDRDKALASVGGRPMIRRVADAVRAATGRPPVIAVADTDRRDRYQGVLDSAEFVLDDPDHDGPLGGLAAAVDRVEADRLFACACDMPDLAVDAIEWLADEWAAEAVVPVADGVSQPLHAWYRREALAAAIANDPDRLLAILDELEVDFISAEDAPADVTLAASLRNINTRAALDER